MDDTDEFSKLLDLVRSGDAVASAKLIKSYESDLRVIARVKLNDPRMRRLVDSMDVCQSVLANFFFRASAGQFDIESPDQLIKLLGTMVRNKVTDYARKQNADRRSQGRLADVDVQELPIVAIQDTPSQIVAAKELAAEAAQRFAPDEREILELRKTGLSWEEIAKQLKGTPEALRKKMTRAVDRVAADLGLGDLESDG